MTDYTYAATPSHCSHKATALAWAQQTEIGIARFDDQVPAKDLAAAHRVSRSTMYNILHSERVIRDAHAAKIAYLNSQAESLNNARREALRQSESDYALRQEALKGWSSVWGEMDKKEQAARSSLSTARAEIFCLQNTIDDLRAARRRGRVAGALAAITAASATVIATLALAGNI